MGASACLQPPQAEPGFQKSLHPGDKSHAVPPQIPASPVQQLGVFMGPKSTHCRQPDPEKMCCPHLAALASSQSLPGPAPNSSEPGSQALGDFLTLSPWGHSQWLVSWCLDSGTGESHAPPSHKEVRGAYPELGGVLREPPAGEGLPSTDTGGQGWRRGRGSLAQGKLGRAGRKMLKV